MADLATYPTDQAICRLLAGEALPTAAIAYRLGLPDRTARHRLRQLRRAGLVISGPDLVHRLAVGPSLALADPAPAVAAGPSLDLADPGPALADPGPALAEASDSDGSSSGNGGSPGSGAVLVLAALALAVAGGLAAALLARRATPPPPSPAPPTLPVWYPGDPWGGAGWSQW